MSNIESPRVMFLIRDMECGGAQRVVVNTLLGLCDTRLDLHLGVIYDNDYSMLTHLAGTRVRIVKLEKHGRYDLRALGRLIRYLREERIDILHMHGYNAALWGGLAAWRAGTPVVIRHVHINQLPRLAVHIERGMKFLVDEYVAVGEGNRQSLARYLKIPVERVRLIHNSVDTDLFSPGRGANPDSLGFPVDSVLVGTVGRLARQKGHDVLVSAARLVVDAQPQAGFVIAGTGPLKTQTKDQIRRMSVSNTVRLLGVLNDMPRFYQSLDLFVLPSRFEGMPVCLLEAMACGCPSVVTDIEGCRELVSDGVEGLVVPPEDPKAMADAIVNLLQDPDMRVKMGSAAREKVLKVASPKVAVGAHLQLYRDCLARNA